MHPFALVAVIAFAAGCGSSPPNLDKTIESYGYAVLQPPSMLTAPGAVVAVRQGATLQLDVVCSQQSILGTVTPIESPSASGEIEGKTSTTFELSGDVLDTLKADAKYQRLRTIHLTLSDVKVLAVTADQIAGAVASPDCKKAIAQYHTDGVPLSVVETVLQADVVYTIDFETDAGLDVDAKKGLVKNLAATLGADDSTATDSTIKGSALFWGAKDSIELFRLLSPETPVKDVRVLPPGAHVRTL